MKITTYLKLILLSFFVSPSFGAEVIVSQYVWHQFTISERATLTEKFPSIEIISTDNIGIIQSVQSVNRSTNGTNAGAIIGGAVGQAVYIDKAFSGSGNNYSAVRHIGAALLGAAAGSTLDQAPQTKFEFNYAIRNPNGNIREQRILTADEFTKPIGQCVVLPEFKPVISLSCSASKNEFLKALSTVPISNENIAIDSTASSALRISCRVPGVGLMTLDRKVCLDMEGKIE
jgi:outer membrane lipoprotein SlyB